MSLVAQKYPALAAVPPARLPMLVAAMKRHEFLRTPLVDWVPKISPQYMRPAHLAPLLDTLTRAEAGESIRLCVACPPRHSKSESLLHAIAWYLARNPTKTVAYVTYSAALARSKSRLARDYAQRAGVRLREDAEGLSEWRTVQGGGLLAVGVEGGLTGYGVDLLVVDDPIRNREDAESVQLQEKLWEWFSSVALTRLEPGASAIVCHTRWNPADLIGRLLKEQPGGRWQEINLPAVNEDGKALWPERWTAYALAERRAEVGLFDWNALYMGRPVPKGSHVFVQPARYDQVQLAGRRLLISVDPAATASTKADFSVVTVLAYAGSGKDLRADVIEVYRRQVEIPTLCVELSRLQRRYPGAPIVCEAAGVGKAVPQMLRQIDPKLRIVEVHPRGDKFTRAQSVALAVAEGRVRVPGSAPWLHDWLTELLNFTGVADRHDDVVDSLSLGWNHVASSAVAVTHVDRGPFAKAPPRRVDEWGRPIRS